MYPTRLVVPATDFAAGFSSVGHHAIRNILDNHGANYTRHTITQASDVKNKLEKLNIREENVSLHAMQNGETKQSTTFSKQYQKKQLMKTNWQLIWKAHS